MRSQAEFGRSLDFCPTFEIFILLGQIISFLAKFLPQLIFCPVCHYREIQICSSVVLGIVGSYGGEGCALLPVEDSVVILD